MNLQVNLSVFLLNVMQVHKDVKQLDPNKPAGPDQLDPYFIKLPVDFIAEPLTSIFSLTLQNSKIPVI